MQRQAHMTTITLRMNDETKEKLDLFCNNTGLNITTFYMIYTNKVLKEGRIPFEIDSKPHDKTVQDSARQKGWDELLNLAGKLRIDEKSLNRLRKDSLIG